MRAYLAVCVFIAGLFLLGGTRPVTGADSIRLRVSPHVAGAPATLRDRHVDYADQLGSHAGGVWGPDRGPEPSPGRAPGRWTAPTDRAPSRWSGPTCRPGTTTCTCG